MSDLFSCTMFTPGMSRRRASASIRPLALGRGRSICVVSPEMTIFEPRPMRVRNIFIWAIGRVLGFVENDERLVERAAAHVGQRHDLDHVLLHVPLHLVVVHHLVQRVEQRPQVRIDLGVQVAGQKAEAFARFDRGPDEHDLADLMVLERLDRHGDRQIGLAGARRADGERDVVLADRLDIAGLPLRPRGNPPGRLHIDGRRGRPSAALPVTWPSTSLT